MGAELSRYFLSGWLFFIPYFLLYVGAFLTHGSTAQLGRIFNCLHVAHALLFGLFVLLSRSRKKTWGNLIFFLALFLIFTSVGAYLEFPSDPWEHFRRIFLWQTYETISSNPYANKFAYFWGWSLLSNLPLELWRSGLNFYGAFWMLLFYWQWYRLIKVFGLDEGWNRALIFAIIALFGNNLFSFRYYALSSTPLAYIAYLVILRQFLNLQKAWPSRGRWGSTFLSVLVLIPLIYLSHIQELMLLLVGTSAVIAGSPVVVRFFSKRSRLRVALAILGLTYFFSYWILSAPISVQRQAIGIIRFVFQPVLHSFGRSPWDLSGSALSPFGVLRFWDPSAPYFKALGLHGIFGMVAAVVFFKKYRQIALFTLAPLAWMVFPPFVLTLSALTDLGNTYRILYAFPTGLMFALGLKEVIERISRITPLRHSGRTAVLLITASVVMVVGLMPMDPVYGRLWFELNRPTSPLTLRDRDLTMSWFATHRILDRGCKIMSDPGTAFLLSTYFGYGWAPRLEHPVHTVSRDTPEKLQEFINNFYVCGFLIPRLDQVPPTPTSSVAKLSHHWPDFWVQSSKQFSPGFLKSAEFIIKESKWVKTEVPPYYDLYQPPERVKR